MNKENKEKVKKNICPINDCGRPTHKKSEYCIFHAEPEEKEEEEFKKALKKYIEKIKENNLDYDFFGFIFVGNINFKKEFKVNTFKDANFRYATFESEATFGEVTFKGETDFSDATFEGEVWFGEVTFKGKIDFSDATFEGEIWFLHATFKDEAVFWDATFKGKASFSDAIFESKAIFSDATFESEATFGEVTFEGNTDFSDATFKENTSFRDATFEGNTDFSDATFEGDADFVFATFENNVHFDLATLPKGKTLVLKVKSKSNISFMHTILENICLELDLEKEAFINFTNSILRNTQIKKEKINGHILQEQTKDFFKAKEIYLLLKNNFHSIGRYDDESWAFKKEKDMERKSNCHFETLHKWLWSCFLNGIFGYGERPVRVIISAISIILIFTFLFMNSGISDTSIGGFTSNNFLDCVYFSVITFTTLGYGDFRPLEGWSRIFAGTEAFIGALMMALFVYTFARKTGGR